MLFCFCVFCVCEPTKNLYAEIQYDTTQHNAIHVLLGVVSAPSWLGIDAYSAAKSAAVGRDSSESVAAAAAATATATVASAAEALPPSEGSETSVVGTEGESFKVRESLCILRLGAGVAFVLGGGRWWLVGCWGIVLCKCRPVLRPEGTSTKVRVVSMAAGAAVLCTGQGTAPSSRPPGGRRDYRVKQPNKHTRRKSHKIKIKLEVQGGARC